MVQRIITRKKPVNIPKLNGKAFRNPFWAALFIDMILFGPGVEVAIIT